MIRCTRYKACIIQISNFVNNLSNSYILIMENYAQLNLSEIKNRRKR